MVGIGLSASVGSVHCTSFDGLGASSLCGVGRRASSSTSAVMVSADPPASPPACCMDTSGKVDQVTLSSPCLNLDELSSSDDDTGELVGLSDLSITLLCDSDEILTPVNSDQVLSDVDLPIESVSHDKRQVIRIRDVSPDVQIVDASQVGRAWDSQRPVSSVASGKSMPGKVSMAISRAPLSLDMTATCTSGVAPTSAHPPAVTSIPAKSTATEYGHHY